MPAIAWNAARDRLDCCPRSAWNGARHQRGIVPVIAWNTHLAGKRPRDVFDSDPEVVVAHAQYMYEAEFFAG